MTLELHVLAGARRGTVVRSDKPVVVLGRQAGCDLQLDPERDLEVSARHAELRLAHGAWLLRDAGSTNGTFVNGVRIAGERPLRHGDVIGLGAAGPSVRLHLVGAPTRARRGALVAATLLAVGIAVPLVMVWNRRQAPAAPATQAGRSAPAIGASIPAANDFRAAFATNGPAVAYVVTELEGKPYGGTAFGVTPGGRLVTNRHLVVGGAARATRVMVKYADTGRWLRARVVRTADEGTDLAVLQVEDSTGAPFPVVAGISDSTPAISAPVATIGFPLADGTPMDSLDGEALARASLIPGTVSKRLDRVLQIFSYATHGSSGSPVFDQAGQVVGVIYGGARDTGGRIVYAVPGGVVKALLAEGR